MKQHTKVGAGLLATVTLFGTLMGTSATASADTSDNSTFSMFFNLNASKGLSPSIFSWEMYLDAEGIYEGLVIPGPNSATKPTPGIATSWKSSNNNQTWTFTLRSNAKFDNGDPVTAQDFVFGIQHAVDPQTGVNDGGSLVPVTLLPIVNAQQVRLGTPGMSLSDIGVKAINNTTLQIDLTRPDPTFVRDLTLPANGWVVPLDPATTKGLTAADWNNPAKVNGDGPYMPSAFTPNTSITLVPNPNYYGKVNFKKINAYFNSSQTTDTSLAAYKSGSMDEVLLQTGDLGAVLQDPNLKKALVFSPSSAQYSFTPAPSKNRALQNPKVREAFSLAINRDLIAKQVLQGAASPAYGYWEPTSLNPWVKKYATKYDVAKAQKLMAEAGYPGGKGFPTVEILDGSPVDIVAAAIQQMWEQNLGVKVEFKGMLYSAFVAAQGTQLPSNQVGWIQVATNAMYPNLSLPQTIDSWLWPGNTSLANGYLSPNYYNAWYSINNNKKLTKVQAENAELSIYNKELPKYYLNWLKLGVKAFNSGSTNLMEQYYGQAIQQAYQIAVYTPDTPILVSPKVKGYAANTFLLDAVPYWLNSITKS